MQEINHERYYSDLEMARLVQQALLNRPRPPVDGAIIAASYRAAEFLGGDFFTIHANQSERLVGTESRPGIIEYKSAHHPRLLIGIGDVAGHGISSALVMALSTGLINELSRNQASPQVILNELNQSLCKYLKNSSISYVTGMMLEYSPIDRRLTVSRAGHPYPIRISGDGTTQILESDGVFLGMFETEQYTSLTYTLEIGDRLIVYTDGITECKNAAREEYGTDRLIEYATRNHKLSPQDIVSQLFTELDQFSNLPAPTDDQTIVVIDITANA